jgi:hypothetical protein
MIDIAWKALSVAPTAMGTQKQSCSALKRQICMFALAFLVFLGDSPAHHQASFTFVKADQPVHCLRG